MGALRTWYEYSAITKRKRYEYNANTIGPPDACNTCQTRMQPQYNTNKTPITYQISNRTIRVRHSDDTDPSRAHNENNIKRH